MGCVTLSRSAGIDAIRVGGICAVIFGHVYAGALTHQWVYSWHVPLFFVLTGYLWKPGRTIGKELSIRTRALMVPYVSWFVVVSLIVLAVPAENSPWNVTTLLAPLWGGSQATGPYGTFWFVSVLFFTALFYRAIDRLPRTVQWAIAVVGVVAAYYAGPQLAGLPLGVGLAWPCLIFLLAGRGIAAVEPRLSHPRSVGLLVLAAGAAVIAFFPLDDVDLKQGLFGTPLIGILIAVAVSMGLLLACRTIPFGDGLSRLMAALAVVGIAVVLSHPLVVWAFPLMGFLPKWTLLAAVIVPWGVALVIARFRFSVLLIGPSTRKSRVLPVTAEPQT